MSSRVVVFVARKETAHRLRIVLGLLGLKVSELHGALTQEQRLQNVKNFKSLEVPVLICTDLAARGLDIPKIELVINYDMPKHLKSICIEWEGLPELEETDIYHICWRIKPRKSYCQICHRQRQRCSQNCRLETSGRNK